MSGETAVKYLIVGGGAAAAQASVGVREIDSEGSVLLVAGEKWWPYDRPPLSKGILMGRMTPEDAESKDPSFYLANAIEVRRGVAATALDRTAKVVTLSDGTSVSYEKLLIATGSSPRPLDVPGTQLEGVQLFRTADDSLKLKDSVQAGTRVVMVGAGYVGLEVGDRLLELGAEVTLVDPNGHPWSKFASPAAGGYLSQYMLGRGAKLVLGDTVAEILGDGKVSGVRTASGTEIPADLVVIGIGVTLNTDFAQRAGLEIDAEHGIVVQETLRTADPDIYAAGDVAAFPDVTSDRRWHAEHQLNAKWQGKTAGRNMAGANETYDRVSYFFSDLIGTHMILRGNPYAGRSAQVFGDVNAGEFVEVYERADGTVVMGIAFSTEESKLDPISDALEELIRSRAVVADLTPDALGIK